MLNEPMENNLTVNEYNKLTNQYNTIRKQYKEYRCNHCDRFYLRDAVEISYNGQNIICFRCIDKIIGEKR